MTAIYIIFIKIVNIFYLYSFIFLRVFFNFILLIISVKVRRTVMYMNKYNMMMNVSIF